MISDRNDDMMKNLKYISGMRSGLRRLMSRRKDGTADLSGKDGYLREGIALVK